MPLPEAMGKQIPTAVERGSRNQSDAKPPVATCRVARLRKGKQNGKIAAVNWKSFYFKGSETKYI